MKKIMLLALVLVMLLSACSIVHSTSQKPEENTESIEPLVTSPDIAQSKESIEPTETSPDIPQSAVDLINSADAEVRSGNEITISSGLLSDLFDLEIAHFVGYDGDGGLIIRNYDDYSLRKVDMLTKEITEIISIDTGKGNSIMAEIFADDWYVWSECIDEGLDGSIGKGWAVCASNIKSGEIIVLDSENQFFPESRNFDALPIWLAIKDGYVAFVGYEADNSGIYKAVKLYNLNSRRLETINRNNKANVAYGGVYIGDGVVVFASAVLGGDHWLHDNIIYVYNIMEEKLNVLESDFNLAHPVTSGNYIAATELTNDLQADERVLFYDISKGEWVSVLNADSSVFKDDVYPFRPRDAQISGDYFVWRDPSTDQSFEVYDVKRNTFYEFLNRSENRRLGYILWFNGDFLAWADHNVEIKDPQFHYAILAQ